MKARINETGGFLGNYTLDWLADNEELVENWILVDPCSDEFIKKFWNGFEWVEGATEEEKNANKSALYLLKIQDMLADLRIRAKGLAIGKTGSNAYIIAQVEFYQRKYDNASNPDPIPEIDADLEAEGLRDFEMDLNTFKILIISMYNEGKLKENLLMCFIEQGRSAILTLMANAEWAKVDTALGLIENLKGITTIEQAREVKNQILELCYVGE